MVFIVTPDAGTSTSTKSIVLEAMNNKKAKRVQKVASNQQPQKNMYKREGSEFAEEQHGIVVRASWSVVSTMEQCDGERVIAQVAIAIWLRRMMQYREPMNVS